MAGTDEEQGLGLGLAEAIRLIREDLLTARAAGAGRGRRWVRFPMALRA